MFIFIFRFIIFLFLLTLQENFVTCDYFKIFEDQMLGELGRQATEVLQDDLAGAMDSPKEIEISCPQAQIYIWSLMIDF